MVVSIAQREDLDRARWFQERHRLSYPVLPDPRGGVYASYTRATLLGRVLLPNQSFLGLPYNVVIDRRGSVRYARTGTALDDLTASVEDLLGRP